MYISMGPGVLWSWDAVYSMRTVLSADAALSDWVKEITYFAPVIFCFTPDL